MTKVLQAMAGAEFGGAEAFFERLTLALHHAGLDQRVLIRDNEKRARRLREAGLDVVEMPFGGRLDIKTPWRFRRAVKDFQPQIALTWMNRATRFCPQGNFTHVARLGGYYDLKYYRKCRHLIGNTPDIVQYIVDQGWPAERAHYLPNFVSAETAPPVARESLYTPLHIPLILALGRLHENKGFDVLLDALAKVPGVYLWLAGDGPKRAELEAQAEKLGIKPRVRFLGWRDDVASLFAAADLFVCPSRHEPLGNVVIEAWAQAIPVIATASQGPTALIEDGVNGMLTPLDDAAALAQSIEALLTDRGQARLIGTAGRQAYEAHFTEQAVVAQYMTFFDRVAETDSVPD